MTTYQDKIRGMVDYCTQNFIAEVPRDIYTFKDSSSRQSCFPITTTLLLLNSCLGKNTLLEGERGTGKTKLVSVAGSLVFQLPYEFLLQPGKPWRYFLAE
ncbi:hypothetical protein HYX14_02355 [Candidatus Woesearchaeota archaeon]|nr:hypothetical protein [Candidatus Woesearchaeota archaeon]